jgi:NADH-quinone oxidoreductase subunit E
MTAPDPVARNSGGAMLSEQTRETIDHWVSKFPSDKKRSALIQALLAAQEQNGGWITRELTEAVAGYLELPPVWAHEVVSFYSMFFTQPAGRHKVNICTNISCWLRGGTTEDGRITLVREEECLAGCCGAPMMVVDGHYHENLDFEQLDAILEGLE